MSRLHSMNLGSQNRLKQDLKEMENIFITKPTSSPIVPEIEQLHIGVYAHFLENGRYVVATTENQEIDGARSVADKSDRSNLILHWSSGKLSSIGGAGETICQAGTGRD